MTEILVCPCCANVLGKYAFRTPDGVVIILWSCLKCGRDVVPKLATA